MDFERSLRRKLHSEAEVVDGTPPPVDELLASPIAITPRRHRTHRTHVVAAAMSVACVAIAIVAISAVRNDPTHPSPGENRASAAEPFPTTTPSEPPGLTTTPVETADPSPLVVDDPACRDLSAYEVAASPFTASDLQGVWYIPGDENRTEGWGFLYAPGGLTVPPVLSGPEISGSAEILDDGTGLYDWSRNGATIARLSTKDMDLETIDRLAQAIGSGAPEEAGYLALPSPQEHPQILGSSCTTGSSLFGVEVVVGDLAAQVDHLGNSDPAAVEFGDGYAIATYGHSPLEPLRTRVPTPSEWQALLQATEAEGPP